MVDPIYKYIQYINIPFRNIDRLFVFLFGVEDFFFQDIL